MKYLVAVLFVLAVGCEKNPYPSKGILTKTQPGVIEEVRPAISADIPDTVEFKEGFETSVTFRAVVPAPGKPVLSIEKLPEGAFFNPETLTISWTPDFNAGNVPNEPTQKVRIYPIVVWVRSSEDEINALRKSVNLVVYDQPRAITVNSSSSFQINEMEAASYAFSIDNADYANGPFDVSLGDFPVNATLVKVSSKEYKVNFNPDFQHVNILKDKSCFATSPCREYKSKIIVSNPAGHRTEKSVVIKIVDKRTAPKAVAIDEMEQGLDVNFQVGGYDLNSEVTPNVTLISKTPTVGNFSLSLVKDEATYSTVARVSWLDLPPSLNGSQHVFKFKVCALDRTATYNNCVETAATVNIKVRERLAPVIDRSSWQIGEMKYLNFNQSAEFKINVRDAQIASSKPAVEIFPESARAFVTWNNQTLRVKFNKTGIFQFNVTATSEYGLKSIEGFVVEVFPENRGEALLLADSSRDKEVQFFRKQFSNLEVVNPFLQDLGTRLLSGRKTLVVGTSVLVDPESKEKVQLAVDSIRNVLIATPLIHNLPDDLYRQITDDFRISIVGRFLDIPKMPKLAEMEFVTRHDFAVSKAPMTLAQNTTLESSNPLIFSTGVDTNNCDDVLEISDSMRLNRLKIGIICDRPGSGRLALLGTEWADIKASIVEDELIPSKWLSTMMTAGLVRSNEVLP